MRTNRFGKKHFHRKTKKMRGGLNDEFTVMTFNVECWLNQMTMTIDMNNSLFSNFLKNNNTAEIALGKAFSIKQNEYIEKLKKLKKIFNTVDVACVQEDVITSGKNISDKIGDLPLVASCLSHKFDWETTKRLYGNDGGLANSIYSKLPIEGGSYLLVNSQLENDLTIDISPSKKIPRCWASTLIKVGEKTAKIACIHLSGGRFDDIKSLKDDYFIVKIRQIHELITKETPDIICGDLNTKLVPKNVDDDAYFLGLPHNETQTVRKYFEANPDQKIIRKDLTPIYDLIRDKIEGKEADLSQITLAEKWHIWMYGLDQFFKNNSYKSVFQVKPKHVPHHRTNTISSKSKQVESSKHHQDFLEQHKCKEEETDISHAPDTTIFGGTVDMIYYKCDKVYCTGGGEAVPGVISFQNKTGQKILSDHAPIKASFRIL